MSWLSLEVNHCTVKMVFSWYSLQGTLFSADTPYRENCFQLILFTEKTVFSWYSFRQYQLKTIFCVWGIHCKQFSLYRVYGELCFLCWVDRVDWLKTIVHCRDISLKQFALKGVSAGNNFDWSIANTLLNDGLSAENNFCCSEYQLTTILNVGNCSPPMVTFIIHLIAQVFTFLYYEPIIL